MILGENAAALYGFDLEALKPLAREFGPTPEQVDEPLPAVATPVYRLRAGDLLRVKFWGADELDRALEACGFEIVESAEEDHPAQRWLVRHARTLGPGR